MSTKHVVILGGGFAGLECAKKLRDENIRVTLVDRWNHHLFQPLLYQVASGALAMAKIAQPLRSILADQKNVTTLMDEVVNIDLPTKRVHLKTRVLDYDFLVIALGAKTSFFGHNDWAQHTLGLKSLDDAMAIRNIASLTDKHGVKVPGVSPAAIQMGGFIANSIQNERVDSTRPAFGYWDKGSMATIGRSAAVVSFAGMQVKGFIAWLMWLFVHLVFLMNMRNRLSVFVHWVWSYFTWQRGARVIQSPKDQ